MPLLEVSGLTITLQTPRGRARAVQNLEFILERGATLGLIGESGCGKSLTALALMGLLPEHAQVDGSIRLNGQELLDMDERALCRLRGNRMAMVFQEPMTALNPVHGIGRQVAEPLRHHQRLGRQAARERAVALLERVGIARAAQRFDDYPHQFSGGQRQRINIARALATRPELVVCDEPVSALDIAIRAQILNLLARLQRELGLSYLFISHDMAVVEHICDDIAVMYLGQIVERAPRQAFFARPLHPYSVALMSAVPTVRGGRERAARRIRLAGDPPSPIDPPAGCRFAGRCPVAVPACSAEAPPLREAAPGHWVRCIRVDHIDGVPRAPLAL